MKQCFKCLAVKPIEEFYSHPKMKGGVLNKCKECARQENKARMKRLSSNPEWVEKELERHRLKQRKKSTVISSERKRLYLDRYNKKYPEKAAARKAVANALQEGRLLKMPCSICGNLKAEAHHEDYSRPLDVVWYCSKHHAERHVEIRKKQRATKIKQFN